MKMTREQYLEQQRKASEALLAQIMAETEATITTEAQTSPQQNGFEYIPDGGGETRKTRSGKWLMDLE